MSKQFTKFRSFDADENDWHEDRRMARYKDNHRSEKLAKRRDHDKAFEVDPEIMRSK